MYMYDLKFNENGILRGWNLITKKTYQCDSCNKYITTYKDGINEYLFYPFCGHKKGQGISLGE